MVIAPYTTNYGAGNAPWTVTLVSIGLSSSETVSGSPVPIATYNTGFNFSVTSTGLPNGSLGVLWTAANGTYPVSSAVDIDEATLAPGNQVTGQRVLLSDINNLYQFHAASAALGDTAQMVAYSTYNTVSGTEQIHLAGFQADGTPIASESNVLETFSSPQGYDGFGFGTLTPSTGANPSFIDLRGIANGGSPTIAYETVSTTGTATSALTAIQPGYSAGSTNRQLVDWVWDRVDPTATSSNNLATVALLSDTAASGLSEKSLDVQIRNTAGGPAAEDIVALNTGSTNLGIARLSGGGFVVGYTDASVAYLRAYDDNGDVVSAGSYTLPGNPTTFSMEQMADGRLLVSYATNGSTTLSYDIFTVPDGPTAYYADKGITRRNIALGENETLTVKGGGYAADTVTSSMAGGIIVQAGGTTARTVVNGGWGEEILAKAASTGTTLNAGQQFVVTGGTATGTVVNSGGYQSSAGTTRDTVVNNTATQDVSRPGVDFAATLNAGSDQLLTGTAYGTAIHGGDQLVMSGGNAFGAVVANGEQEIQQGGRAANTTVNGGIQFIESGGTAMLTTVNGVGELKVSDGGSVWGALINGTGVAMLAGDGNVIGADGPTGVTLNGGTLVKSSGSGVSRVTTAIVATGSTPGTVESASGSLEIAGTLSGPLMLKSDAGARLILDKAADAGSAFSFNGAGATLLLNDASEFHGTITGLASGQHLDLRSILDGSGTQATLSYAPSGTSGSAGVLSVSDGKHAASLGLIGNYAASGFHLAQDGVGGSLITYG